GERIWLGIPLVQLISGVQNVRSRFLPSRNSCLRKGRFCGNGNAAHAGPITRLKPSYAKMTVPESSRRSLQAACSCSDPVNPSTPFSPSLLVPWISSGRTEGLSHRVLQSGAYRISQNFQEGC